jgi:hypothetical protein
MWILPKIGHDMAPLLNGAHPRTVNAMNLLPFDPLSPRTLSLVLLGLIVLLTYADTNGVKVNTSAAGRAPACTGTSESDFGCRKSRNTIQNGNLTVRHSFD